MPKLNPLEEKEKFFKAIKSHPFSALLMLGKLFTLAHSDLKAKELLDELPTLLRTEQLDSLIGSLNELNDNQLRALDPITRHSIHAAKEGLLKAPAWSCLCSTGVFTQLGQEPDLTRWSMIRLIEQANPNQLFDIPEIIVDCASLAQTREKIAQELKKARLLPKKPLVALAHSLESAQAVLNDLSQHSQVYALGKMMVDKHPELAAPLAQQWTELKASVPLSPVALENMNKYAKTLAPSHPEFEAINKAERLHQKPMPPSPLSKGSYFNLLTLENSAAAAWALVNAPSMYRLSHACYVGARTLMYSTAGPSPAALGVSALMLGTRFITPVATYTAGKKLYQRFKG